MLIIIIVVPQPKQGEAMDSFTFFVVCVAVAGELTSSIVLFHRRDRT